MSCLVASNGFRFEESSVQLSREDVDTLVNERRFFETWPAPATQPPFFVPDHLAPRCSSCKVLFSVTVRRYHCRSCGLVLCGDCFKWRATNIVPIDERVRSRRKVAQAPMHIGGPDQEEGGVALSESQLNRAVEMSIKDRGSGPRPSIGTRNFGFHSSPAPAV